MLIFCSYFLFFLKKVNMRQKQLFIYSIIIFFKSCLNFSITTSKNKTSAPLFENLPLEDSLIDRNNTKIRFFFLTFYFF